MLLCSAALPDIAHRTIGQQMAQAALRMWFVSNHGFLAVLSQSSIFEAKCENRVSKNQWLASLNFPVFDNLRQNSHAAREHHDP
jgi:hypothetical protein